jgi:hypothetical protein
MRYSPQACAAVRLFVIALSTVQISGLSINRQRTRLYPVRLRKIAASRVHYGYRIVTRGKSVAIGFSQSLKGEDVVRVFNRFKQQRGVSKLFDESEFTSQAMDLWLSERNKARLLTA